MLAKNQNKLFLFLLIFHWVVLWASINTAPSYLGFIFDINRMFTFSNLNESSKIARSLLPLISTFFLIILLFLMLFKKKIKVHKIHFLFLIFFLCQLLGLYFNEDKFFCDPKVIGQFAIEDNLNLYDDAKYLKTCYLHLSYLPLISIGTISLFVICDYLNIKNLLKYFFWIAFFFLLISSLVTIFPYINLLSNLDFSNIFAEKRANFFLLPTQRTGGLSRSLSLINLLLIIISFNLKKTNFRYFLIITITFISTIIIFIQSRGSLLCYFICLILFISLIYKTNYKVKIRNFVILILFPFVLYFVINNYFNKFSIEDNKINNRIFEKHTSGRIDIWVHSIRNNNYKKFFGYGTQGDRFFLMNCQVCDKYGYGKNSSNAYIYALLSGGIISVLILVLLLYEIIKLILFNSKNVFFKKKFIYKNFSILCIIFILIRSLIENSFSVFSIDYLIIYLSITYMISLNRNHKEQ